MKTGHVLGGGRLLHINFVPFTKATSTACNLYCSRCKRSLQRHPSRNTDVIYKYSVKTLFAANVFNPNCVHNKYKTINTRRLLERWTVDGRIHVWHFYTPEGVFSTSILRTSKYIKTNIAVALNNIIRMNKYLQRE